VPRHSLPRKSVDSIHALGAIENLERLRLATRAAAETAFDWTIPDDRITWDGATQILSPFANSDVLNRGSAFLAWIGASGRERIYSILSEAGTKEIVFEFEFQSTSAMEAGWFEVRGVGVPGSKGGTERIAGVVRLVTERKRDAQRLTYVATRDELTGHLNRTTLRSELGRAIEQARKEERQCSYLVAAIDRLAIINEAYGFGAADEVIVAVSERLAASLRETDLIGRIAGNKFGIVLSSCSEAEMSAIAGRLRAVVRSDVISTRRGAVSATISVGAVLLPSTASSGQEAMLRAEEALDRARGGGRDGYSIYEPSPQREMARLRLPQHCGKIAWRSPTSRS